MSAASRAREQAAKEAALKKKYADLPEPDAPPEPLDEETSRLLAWFVTDREKIAEAFGVEKLILDCDEGIFAVKKRSL